MKPILIKLAFIAVLIVAFWGVMQWQASINKGDDQILPPKDDSAQNGSQFAEAISVVHDFEDGVHVITGQMDLPTPCHELNVSADVLETEPEKAVINFTVTEPEEDEMCIQVIDIREFEVEFSAQPNVVLEGRVNGKSVPLFIEDNAGTLEQITPEN